MMKKLKTAMKVSISEILEKMFYMSYEFDENSNIKESGIFTSGRTFSCRLSFKGLFSGYFILMVPEKLLFELTQSFMGLERDEINENHLNGTIKELINMIAGSTFSNYDDEAEFHLHIPELIELNKIAESTLHPDKEEFCLLTLTTQGYLGLKLLYSNGI